MHPHIALVLGTLWSLATTWTAETAFAPPARLSAPRAPRPADLAVERYVDPSEESVAKAAEFFRRQDLLAAGVNVDNLGRPCWAACGHAEGECAGFCGRGALCCRDGWGHADTDCVGFLGESDKHVCVERASADFLTDAKKLHDLANRYG